MEEQKKQKTRKKIAGFEVEGNSIKVISVSGRCCKSLTCEEIREILSSDVYERLGRDPHRIVHLFETITVDTDGQNSSVNFLSSHFQCNGIQKTVGNIKRNLLGKI